jgi:hypothetical protein
MPLDGDHLLCKLRDEIEFYLIAAYTLNFG